jgi:hypothetical protein
VVENFLSEYQWLNLKIWRGGRIANENPTHIGAQDISSSHAWSELTAIRIALAQ